MAHPKCSTLVQSGYYKSTYEESEAEAELEEEKSEEDVVSKKSVNAKDASVDENDHADHKESEEQEYEEEKFGNDLSENEEVDSADDENGGHKENKKRLTGKQLSKDHYVDRYIPGVVESHPEDNRPTNAIVWSGNIDSGWGVWEYYKELVRTHPGDDPCDHEKFSQEKAVLEIIARKTFSL